MSAFQPTVPTPKTTTACFNSKWRRSWREEALSKGSADELAKRSSLAAPYENACTMDMPWLTQSVNATGALGTHPDKKTDLTTATWRISVVTVCYNAAPTLADAVESVLGQLPDGRSAL